MIMEMISNLIGIQHTQSNDRISLRKRIGILLVDKTGTFARKSYL